MLSTEGNTLRNKGNHFTKTSSYIEELLLQSLHAFKKRRKFLLITRKELIQKFLFSFLVFVRAFKQTTGNQRSESSSSTLQHIEGGHSPIHQQ